MQNVFLTSLTLPEVKSLFRSELREFFSSTSQSEPESTTGKKWADVPTAADYVGVEPSTMRTYARAGQIPSSRVGNSYRFLYSDLDAFISKGARKSNDQIKEEADNITRKKRAA